MPLNEAKEVELNNSLTSVFLYVVGEDTCTENKLLPLMRIYKDIFERNAYDWQIV